MNQSVEIIEPGATEAGVTISPAPRDGAHHGRGAFGAWMSFILLALLPSLLGSYYLIFVASPQYISTAKYVVIEGASAALSVTNEETPHGASAPPLSSLSRVTVSYIDSAAIIEDLEAEVDLRAIFSPKNADDWARMPADADIETFLKFWRDHVRASVDGYSSVVTLTARAFSPEDAQTLVAATLRQIERRLNDLNRPHQEDALAQAAAEFARADAKLAEAIAALEAWRETEGVVDPAQEAGEMLKLLTTLTEDAIEIELAITALEGRVDASSTRLTLLRERRAALASDIAELRAALAAEDEAARSLSEAFGRFQELETKRLLASRIYEITSARLLAAEVDLGRDTLHVVAFVPPTLPQDAAYPERYAWSVLLFVVCIVIWSIVALTVASVRDHQRI